MGFAQTVDAQGKPVHKSGKGSYHQIGLVRGQFGGVPFDKWVKFIADAGFDGWEEAGWELDLRKCDTDAGAAAYAQERVVGGKPIAGLQAIQFKLADMETGTAAARELLYKACVLSDAGDPQAAKYSSMAKLFASDNAMKATVEAVQVLGGYGYVNEYPVERMMRDAKITQIYEGTNEIQRVIIARQMAS